MNREEILDMAMDILENTDATLEEAMGIAMESQIRKMKAEARKTGDWDKVIMRQGLKDSGKLDAARSAYHSANAEINDRRRAMHMNNLDDKYHTSNRPGDDSIPTRFRGESKTRQYRDRVEANQRKFDRDSDHFKRYAVNRSGEYAKADMDYDKAKMRERRMGDYSYTVPVNNGRGESYRLAKYKERKSKEKASKEAAIMDTALDFLDMYDVSLEEAIDMAYAYLID